MSPAQSPRYAPPSDPYKQHRCPACRHLRYADERPGDPCRVCDCPDHVTPLERAERGEGS